MKKQADLEELVEIESNLESNTALLIDKTMEPTWKESAATGQAMQCGSEDTRGHRCRRV